MKFPHGRACSGSGLLYMQLPGICTKEASKRFHQIRGRGHKRGQLKDPLIALRHHTRLVRQAFRPTSSRMRASSVVSHRALPRERALFCRSLLSNSLHRHGGVHISLARSQPSCAGPVGPPLWLLHLLPRRRGLLHQDARLADSNQVKPAAYSDSLQQDPQDRTCAKRPRPSWAPQRWCCWPAGPVPGPAASQQPPPGFAGGWRSPRAGLLLSAPKPEPPSLQGSALPACTRADWAVAGAACRGGGAGLACGSVGSVGSWDCKVVGCWGFVLGRW